MALITRLVTNAGAPLSAPDGALLENTKIIFVLANKVGAPADAWDAATNERVGGDPIIVTTDAKGEFSVELWPNSRGDRLTRYHCTVQHPGFRAFYGVVEESAEPLSWAYFMANGGPLSPQEISQLAAYIAQIEAARDAAQDAAAQAQHQVDLATAQATAAHDDADLTAADRVQTALDRIATGQDKTATAADRVQTALDRTATGQDKTATAADRVQTALDRAAAAASAATFTEPMAAMATALINTQSIVVAHHAFA